MPSACCASDQYTEPVDPLRIGPISRLATSHPRLSATLELLSVKPEHSVTNDFVAVVWVW